MWLAVDCGLRAVTCAVKMPPHPQHPGLYKSGTVAVGQGRQMDQAAYVRAIPGNDGELKAVVLDRALRNPAEVTRDADRNKNMKIKSRDPVDVQFGEQYSAFHDKHLLKCAEEAELAVETTEKQIAIAKLKHLVSGWISSCGSLTEKGLEALKNKKLLDMEFESDEDLIQYLHDIETQVQRNTTVIDMQAKELDLKDHLDKIKPVVKSKDFFDDCRTKIEKAWKERLAGDRSIKVDDIIKKFVLPGKKRKLARTDSQWDDAAAVDVKPLAEKLIKVRTCCCCLGDVAAV